MVVNAYANTTHEVCIHAFTSRGYIYIYMWVSVKMLDGSQPYREAFSLLWFSGSFHSTKKNSRS